MRSAKQLSPQAAAEAAQIGELLDRTVAASRGQSEPRIAAATWWQKQLAALRKNFQQAER